MMPLVKLMIFRDDRREMNCSEWVKTHDHKFDGMNWHEYNILYIYYNILYIYMSYLTYLPAKNSYEIL